jgi:hypothetical protein
MIEGEVTYDEYGNPVEGEDDAVGGLSVYSDPGVQKAMTKFEELARQQQARYDAQAKAIEEKRYGPSFSERMFQLSAALATPTAQRGIGGILANVTPVLQAQMQAKRQGELSRREALEKLQNDRLAQEMGLAKQGVTTATALARINATANKPVRGIAVGDTLRNPFTNEVMGAEYNRVPMPDYYKALEAAPTPENLQAAVAYYPTFAVQLKAAYDRGLKNKGR